MSLEQIAEQIRQKMAYDTQFRATVKFDFGDDGILWVDATQRPPVIKFEDGEAQTTLACSIALFDGLLNGTQDPNLAFLMGKLKIRGSMGVAMKLNAVLES
jgi:putative sterol carrier protein